MMKKSKLERVKELIVRYNIEAGEVPKWTTDTAKDVIKIINKINKEYPKK